MSLSPFFRPRPVSMLGDMMRDLWRIERQMANAFDFPINRGVFNENEITNDNSKFAINMNVQQFKPENLKIDLDGRKLKIEGIQEVDNGEEGYLKRSFCRVVTLPEDVDLTSICSNLLENGNLVIEVPKIEKMKGRSIPIQQKSVTIEEKPEENKKSE